MITPAPTPALACIVGVTGKGRDGKAVIVPVVVGGVSKLILTSLTFLYLCYNNISYLEANHILCDDVYFFTWRLYVTQRII